MFSRDMRSFSEGSNATIRSRITEYFVSNTLLVKEGAAAPI